MLLRSKVFSESALDSVFHGHSRIERVEGLLSLIENGNVEIIEMFVIALKDLGNHDIVELIDPSDICNKAGKCIHHVS